MIVSRQPTLALTASRPAPVRAERAPVPTADALTAALRAAAQGDQRRTTRGAAGRVQDQALRLGWLAPIGGQPLRVCLTVPGEIALSGRI